MVLADEWLDLPSAPACVLVSTHEPIVERLRFDPLRDSPIDPIKALYWSAVINGVVAPPVMIVMMLMTANRRMMGQFIIGGWLRYLGWASTAVMSFCVMAKAAFWMA